MGIFPWGAMAEDSGVPPEVSGFLCATLAINLSNKKVVGAFVTMAERQGAEIIRSPRRCSGAGTRPGSMTSKGTYGISPKIN